MAIHKKKVLYITTGVIMLVVFVGILSLMLNIKGFTTQIEKESIFTSIAGSVSNPLEDAWKFIQGKECTVFYSGSVAQPEG
jgi:ABC-type molybdate transport system substrate-binding protein